MSAPARRFLHASERSYVSGRKRNCGVKWFQHTLKLPPYPRGFHLVTSTVVAALPELARIETGILHVFIQHTSASVSINENADPDVPDDLERAFDAIAPEDFPYEHTTEGPDDMPAHVKAALLGSALSIPVGRGRLCLGTWQGIYLCEHRDRASSRTLVLTLFGEMRGDGPAAS
jgi:secondary thiamine-phosphate synthase enzyme